MADSPLVRRSPVPPRDCNLAKSFDVVGDRWSLLLMRSALYGVRRFDDFQADLSIPRSVLSTRLAALVEQGLMDRCEYREEGQRPRFEYPLTEKGRALGLPFFAMTEWADRWIGGGQGPFSLRRRSSGQPLRVALVDEGGVAAPPTDVEIVITPRKAKPAQRNKA